MESLRDSSKTKKVHEVWDLVGRALMDGLMKKKTHDF
jgi:hypothetical protein